MAKNEVYFKILKPKCKNSYVSYLSYEPTIPLIHTFAVLFSLFSTIPSASLFVVHSNNEPFSNVFFYESVCFGKFCRIYFNITLLYHSYITNCRSYGVIEWVKVASVECKLVSELTLVSKKFVNSSSNVQQKKSCSLQFPNGCS